MELSRGHWLAREVLHQWKRVLKRIDLTSRSLVALMEPGSCFAGTLAEIVFACDRSFMLIGKEKGEDTLRGRLEHAENAIQRAIDSRPLSHNS